MRALQGVSGSATETLRTKMIQTVPGSSRVAQGSRARTGWAGTVIQTGPTGRQRVFGLLPGCAGIIVILCKRRAVRSPKESRGLLKPSPPSAVQACGSRDAGLAGE